MSKTEDQQQTLLSAAQDASANAYAPYSKFSVGAALLFDDGEVFAASNAENASYGLSLCAETIAAAKALNAGRRGGLVAVAVFGPAAAQGSAPISPCGRCRQVLAELAELGRTDPMVWCQSGEGGNVRDYRLSKLLPAAFSMD